LSCWRFVFMCFCQSKHMGCITFVRNEICREACSLFWYSSAYKPIRLESRKPCKHLAGAHHYDIHRKSELARKLFRLASASVLIFGVAWQLHIKAVFHSASISVSSFCLRQTWRPNFTFVGTWGNHLLKLFLKCNWELRYGL
jgi:hypothetical protein